MCLCAPWTPHSLHRGEGGKMHRDQDQRIKMRQSRHRRHMSRHMCMLVCSSLTKTGRQATQVASLYTHAALRMCIDAVCGQPTVASGGLLFPREADLTGVNHPTVNARAMPLRRNTTAAWVVVVGVWVGCHGDDSVRPLTAAREHQLGPPCRGINSVSFRFR